MTTERLLDEAWAVAQREAGDKGNAQATRTNTRGREEGKRWIQDVPEAKAIVHKCLTVQASSYEQVDKEHYMKDMAVLEPRRCERPSGEIVEVAPRFFPGLPFSGCTINMQYITPGQPVKKAKEPTLQWTATDALPDSFVTPRKMPFNKIFGRTGRHQNSRLQHRDGDHTDGMGLITSFSINNEGEDALAGGTWLTNELNLGPKGRAQGLCSNVGTLLEQLF